MKPPKKGQSNVKNRQPNRDEVQQETTIVRPQLPRDRASYDPPTFTPGLVPVGGFTPVWSFGDVKETRKSPAKAVGKKIY